MCCFARASGQTFVKLNVFFVVARQALDYYHGGDMYLFDEFQTSRPAFSRRPRIKNLYDVFRCV